VPKIIQARRRATSPGTGQPAPRTRSGRPDRSPGPARRHRPPARSCRPAPCTPPTSSARRRHPVGLLCAARVRITPGHGHTRTNASPSGPAGLHRPGQNPSSDPCPRAYPGGEALMGGQNPARSRGLRRKAAVAREKGGGCETLPDGRWPARGGPRRARKFIVCASGQWPHRAGTPLARQVTTSPSSAPTSPTHRQHTAGRHHVVRRPAVHAQAREPLRTARERAPSPSRTEPAREQPQWQDHESATSRHRRHPRLLQRHWRSGLARGRRAR
jgi:hypothetical protein